MRIEILKSQRDHFEKACAIMSVSYEIYTNEKNANWETVILPKMTDKEAWDLCKEFQMNVREETLSGFFS